MSIYVHMKLEVEVQVQREVITDLFGGLGSKLEHTSCPETDSSIRDHIRAMSELWSTTHSCCSDVKTDHVG